MKPGRPSKLTRETRQQIIARVKYGTPFKTAAQASGVGYSTARAWIARGKTANSGQYKDFYREVSEAGAQHHSRLAAVVTGAALKDPKYAAWVLTHKYPEYWSEHRANRRETKRVEETEEMSDENIGQIVMDRIAAESARGNAESSNS